MPLYTTGRAGREVNRSAESVRRYIREGIIVPIVDSEGRRLIPEGELAKLREHIEQREHGRRSASR